MPLGEEIVEKASEEMAPHELSLNEQQPRDVEKQSAEPKLVCGEPEGAAEPEGPTRTKLMEVEEELQRVQPAIHAKTKVSLPEVTSGYR